MGDKKIAIKTLVAVLLILIMALIGCGERDSIKNEKVRPKNEEKVGKKMKDFLIELDAKEKIEVGNSLDMTLKVKNDGTKSQVVSYGSPRHHDFEILDSEGNVIWCQTCKDFFIQVIEEETLSVDKEIEYSASWEQVDNDAKVVKAGVYTLRASWLALESGGSVEKKIEIVK